MSTHQNDGSTSDPNADPQFRDMLNLTDATQMNMNDFSADLLPDDFLSLDTFSNDANFQSPISPQDQQSQNIPQPSVENPHSASALNSNGDCDIKDATMSSVGAGPLPTGFGVQLPANVGSTLTDFTKRRNWSARVVEEIKDFLHILTPDGRIMYASPSAKTLTGHDTNALVGKFMTTFIHPDDNSMYVREFNESIASGNPLRFFFRFRKADDTYAIFESHGHPHFSSDVSNLGGTSQTIGFCRGFFMMARPYPTRNAALLDSFLEHKVENERLKRRIADLKREEQEELQQQYMSAGPSGSVSDARPSVSTPSDVNTVTQQYQHQRQGSTGDISLPQSSTAYNGMPPPAKPPVSNYALTQRNLDEALASSRPDSINDKMMRYEASNHFEGIEMLTGLKYKEGERSKGISTGAMSPMLVRGDAGIEIPPNAVRANGRGSEGRHSDSPLGEGGEKSKKKPKLSDEYVCTDCGTLDSPEWRRGPNGPKTLCNACGLRWAKQEKKRSGQLGANGSKQGSISGPQPGMPSVPASTAASQLPNAGVPDSTSGGANSGAVSAQANNNASMQSGGQTVPAAGSSSSTAQTMGGAVERRASLGGMSKPGSASLPPDQLNALGQPMVPMGMTMPSGDPNQTLGGISFMGQSAQGNMMSNMGMRMFGAGGDPGGGAGQGGGGGS